MKKIIFVLLCILFVGCGKYNEKDAYKEFSKNIKDLKSYHLTGELLIYRGEDSYNYDVDVAYQDGECGCYRVSLTNKINNHQQIILKNEEGVYVLTPSLNKSFKFQSDWPYNNSQIYMLDMIMTDLEKDDKRVLEKIDEGYIFSSLVNYSNNNELIKQKVYVNKDLEITSVEVVNKDDNVQMKMNFSKIENNKSFDDNYFKIDNNMTSTTQEEQTVMEEIDSIIYPMYVPVNTYLTSEDKVQLDEGERVILTFDGETPFMLVEETVAIDETLETDIIYGDPYLISDTVGAVTDYSVSWISNGVEYYLVSDSMDPLEMISVAQSISVAAVAK